jgi:hypothetical protein
VNHDVTQLVFAIDDDPLRNLNALIRAGGHPIGFVGARIGGGTVGYHSRPFVEYQHNSHALAYLQTLRVPFLTLLSTHVNRMPDNPRMNQRAGSAVRVAGGESRGPRGGDHTSIAMITAGSSGSR